MHRTSPIAIALAALALAACGGGATTIERAVAPAAEVETTTTEPVDDSPPPTTTTTVPPSTAVLADPEPAATPATRWSIEPYRDAGAWVDVFDWTVEYSPQNTPTVTTASIDRMAALGVRTLYLQTSRFDTALDITEPERLQALIDRAHANGMDVVAWYLPTMTDPDTDVRRLLAAASLDVEGLSINLESRAVDDLAERNRLMVEVTRRVAEALPDEPLGTVILNPFALDVIHPDSWRDFPWAELDPYIDVWQPMLYVTYRRADTPYRDPHIYTEASLRHLRQYYVPTEPVHPVTGIADEMTLAGVEGFVRAARAEGSIGAGIYDWATSTEDMWPPLVGGWG